jgi:uncharacterized protein (TIGR02217 family)
MTSFHDVRFPTGISRRASGGPERRTDVVALASGHEERNSRWAHSRRRYNAGYGVRTLDELHAVISFFEQRRGRLHGFRWKDHADFKSCPPQSTVEPSDQLIGTGDGVTEAYQLIKSYGEGETAYLRPITKPASGSVRVAVDGEEKSVGVDFTVNEQSGLVSFLPGAIPGPAQPVTAGFEFDVPVRFDSDLLTINLDAFAAGQIPDIALVEVRI